MKLTGTNDNMNGWIREFYVRCAQTDAWKPTNEVTMTETDVQHVP